MARWGRAYPIAPHITKFRIVTLAAPSATTNAATGVGSTSATGNGSVDADNGSTITERGFVWSTSINPTTADSKVVDSSTALGSFSDSMATLVASTHYHYRAYAINAIGTAYGADTTFDTTSSATHALLLMLGVG